MSLTNISLTIIFHILTTVLLVVRILKCPKCEVQVLIKRFVLYEPNYDFALESIHNSLIFWNINKNVGNFNLIFFYTNLFSLWLEQLQFQNFKLGHPFRIFLRIRIRLPFFDAFQSKLNPSTFVKCSLVLKIYIFGEISNLQQLNFLNNWNSGFFILWRFKNYCHYIKKKNVPIFLKRSSQF